MANDGHLGFKVNEYGIHLCESRIENSISFGRFQSNYYPLLSFAAMANVGSTQPETMHLCNANVDQSIQSILCINS